MQFNYLKPADALEAIRELQATPGLIVHCEIERDRDHAVTKVMVIRMGRVLE